FYDATMARMIENFQTLLSDIVSEPEKPLSALSLVSKKELKRILMQWNATQKPYTNMCYSQLFEIQVEQTPDAVAVVYEGKHFTYNELNRLANRLAHHLHARGVGAEMLVALLLDRGIHLIADLLAISKICGAFLPLASQH